MLACNLFKLERRIIKNGHIIEKTGKPDIPRYLYHVTSKGNYDSMLKCGFIKTSQDVATPDMKGVFMFAMQNFAKRWANLWVEIFAGMNFNVGSALMNKVALDVDVFNFKNKANVVLLKIPTKDMDIKKLKVRPQNILDISNSDLCKGDSAVYQSIYTRRKNSIEYIYEENINISNVQKIGETQLKYVSKEDCKNKLMGKPYDVLLELLKGQPEEIGVKILSQQNIKENILKFSQFSQL